MTVTVTIMVMTMVMAPTLDYCQQGPVSSCIIFNPFNTWVAFCVRVQGKLGTGLVAVMIVILVLMLVMMVMVMVMVMVVMVMVIMMEDLRGTECTALQGLEEEIA